MGKIKKYAQEFLDEIGYSLGYDWDNLPSLTKMRFYLNETNLNKESEDKNNT